MPKGARKIVNDYLLSRYACYLITQNGETADDIAKRKGLRYREEILDNMESIELSASK